MKKLLGMAAGIVLAAGLASCDWSGTSEDDSWSDRYNWVNFSGVYRPTSPAVIVVTGNSGRGINSFVVTQEGNKLTFVDNNGAVYTGGFGSIRTTGGVSQDTPSSSGTPEQGDTMIGSFEVSGTSSAGYEVTITGTFQGTVGATTTLSLTGRVINGTWIEKGGKTASVNGTAS